MQSRRGLNWAVQVGDQTFTPEAPGGLKGDIALEYNSVGACTAGELTFDGYRDWAPFSRVVRVSLNGSRIWLGVVGLPESTQSATGQRTTRVPLLGLDVLDRDGLAVLGLGSAVPEAGVAGGVQLLGITDPLAPIPTEVTKQNVQGQEVTETVMVDPPFGETVDAAFRRVFQDNPLASWGVRPDGTRVAGVPTGGRQVSSAALNVRAQPANYELTGYVSEFGERPGEKWKPTYHSRAHGGLLPRRGATVESETLLGDVVTAAPITTAMQQFNDTPGAFGTLVGVLDLRELVAGSLNNPLVEDAEYVPTAVTVDVRVRFDHPEMPDAPDANWYGQNVVPLDTWQDAGGWEYLRVTKQRVDQGSEPQDSSELLNLIDAPYFPSELLTHSQAADKTVNIKDKKYWQDVAWTFGSSTPHADLETLKGAFRNTFGEYVRAMFVEPQGQEWSFYTSQLAATVEWGEWLTTSPVGDAAAAIYQAAPAINPTRPTPPPPSNTGGLFSGLANWLEHWQFQMDPKNRRAENARYALDPSRDLGLLKPLYKNVASLTTQRRELLWRFAVPTELLGQLDPTLGEGYRWAFGVTFSGVRLGVTARGTITGTAYYSRRVTGTTNTARDLPAYTMSTLTTPTLQGIILGEIHPGPTLVDGQVVTNARVVLTKDSYRTEFQTGAPNGGRS